MINYKLFFILIFLPLQNLTKAQDFEIYPKLKDDNIKMSDLYENTLLDEYQILSRNIKMMDMAYSVIVPGYIHFKAKENRLGYSILAARFLGYSGLAINYINNKNINNSFSDIYNIKSEYNADKLLFYSSVSLIISSYLFDWIHGKYRLEKKQEIIRYKYSIKLKINKLSQNGNENTNTVGLSLNIKL